MSSRFLSFITIFLGFSGSALAQQDTCKPAELPVGVISIAGDVFRGLAAEDFIGHVQKKPVGIKSLTYDEGARRVVFVVDTDNKISANFRRAEAEMIGIMLAGGRPGDTFALLPARGPGRTVSFTSDHNAIAQSVGASGENKQGVLDAVMVGIEMFGAPQSGDAIVVIAVELEGNHKANAKMVAKALEEHHVRMFGLALGPVATKNSVAGSTVTSTTSQGLAWTTPGVGNFVYNTGDEHFFPLTVNSGGVVLGVIGGDPKRDSNLHDPVVLQRVQQKARAISKMINAFYRMQAEPPQTGRSEDWTLDISETITKHSQPMLVLYPHALGPC